MEERGVGDRIIAGVPFEPDHHLAAAVGDDQVTRRRRRCEGAAELTDRLIDHEPGRS